MLEMRATSLVVNLLYNGYMLQIGLRSLPQALFVCVIMCICKVVRCKHNKLPNDDPFQPWEVVQPTQSYDKPTLITPKERFFIQAQNLAHYDVYPKKYI